MIDEKRYDPIEFPSDCPQPGDYVSPYLLRPLRTERQAARDILRRQLVASESGPCNVISLAFERMWKAGVR